MKEKCHFEINNPAHSTAIQLRLFELGYLWVNDSVGGVAFTGSGSLQIRTDDKKITHMPNREWGSENGHHRLTLDDLYAPPFTKPESIIVPLNDLYSAEVTKESLIVGCQKFPASVIDALVEAHKQVTEG